MANKVLEYYPQPYGDYQLGFCTVDVSGKCNIILKVLNSKQGHTYCTFNRVKIGDEWKSDFSFMDKDYERSFLNECLDQLKPMMSQPEPKETPSAPNHEPDLFKEEEEVPF